jgi:MFS family permease
MSGPTAKGSDLEQASSHEENHIKNGGVPPPTGVADLGGARSRGLQVPEIIAKLTPDQRLDLETRLRKKIDLRLLPMIVLMYIMNYIDRNNIAAAKLAGLPEDLHLHPASGEFQTTVSILFVGYLLMQIPSNLFLNKIGKPAIYLPTCMIVWGMISAATAGVHNYGGLLAIRFFLGFVEAAYFPGCLYYLSCWYTRKELGLRTAILYSGALISGAFSGLISAGITGNMNGSLGYSAWQWYCSSTSLLGALS